MRFASLEIDPAILRLVCIDADYSRSDMNGLNQVLHELRGIADSTLLELEVSYRDNAQFVRRLHKSEHHAIGDAELTLSSRGSLENLVVSPLNGHPQLIPNNSVEIDVHAVGLNFKDVLNVLVPIDAAYLGFVALPPPGSDFAGVVTRLAATNNDHSFAIGDKVYGLAFAML